VNIDEKDDPWPLQGTKMRSLIVLQATGGPARCELQFARRVFLGPSSDADPATEPPIMAVTFRSMRFWGMRVARGAAHDHDFKEQPSQVSDLVRQKYL